MKVIVLGATGFIGSGIASALTRGGHIVYGTTRGASSASQLAAKEIIPIVCDPLTEEGRAKWGEIAKTVDAVIDTLPCMSPEPPVATFKLVESIQREAAGTKITYIYTGGSWVHSRGTGGLESWTSESQPHSGQVLATKWRWQVENLVLTSDKVNGIVIRPSVLYGSSSSLFGMFLFEAAYEAGKKGETIEVASHPDTRMLTVHPDDLGDLYLRVVERGSLLKGQVFIGSNPQSERYTDIMDAVIRVSGAKGYTIRPPSNPFEEAWTSSTNAKPVYGHSLTGWRPTKLSLVDGMDIYWAAFVAAYEEKKSKA